MRIDFLNPVHHPGINTTVRRGLKWATVYPDTELEIYKTGEDEMLHEAAVLSTRIIPIDYVVDNMLTAEHDPSCTTVKGLKKAMERAYPDFTMRDMVVILDYWVY